jgi:valyl-tRNA synthetase
LAAFAAQGRDIKLSEDRIEGYRNFINKIWNASRFILTNLEDNNKYVLSINQLDIEDKWILGELDKTSKTVAEKIESYDFNEAAGSIYHFFWHTFCDWYIEFIKHRIFNDENKEQALATALFVLEKSLVILSPFTPFIAEYIYEIITEGKSISDDEYPELNFEYNKEISDIGNIIELVSMIRNIRGEYNIQPGDKINVKIKTQEKNIKELFKEKSKIIKKLARLESFEFIDNDEPKAATNVSVDFSIFIKLEGLIDVNTEIKRLEKEKKSLEKDFKVYGGKLKNENYLAKAPKNVIEKDKLKFKEVSEKLEKINESIKRLSELC